VHKRKQQVSGTSLTTKLILTLLAAAPAHIAEFTDGLTEVQLHAAPSPGDWSAAEVLAHLRSCADVWGNCIATIINQDNPTIRAVNPRTWIKNTNYLEQDFQPSLQAFTMQRAELLAVLGPLKPKTWSRSARITGAGKVLVRTVQTYAEWMAVHERTHLKQIKHMASAMHK
jgi:hypothetical protein